MDIRSWITHKVRSQRGASLSMALMLMLVCTTVAAIALTAGSASVGRLSQIREIGKSYYNVTSAAKLFAGEMDGTSVDVVRACDATRGSDDWTMDPDSWTLTINGKDVNASSGLNETNATLFEILTCDLLFDTEKPSFEESRMVTPTKVKQTINVVGPRPAPVDVLPDPYSRYEEIKAVVSSGIKPYFADVRISVQRNIDETYSFEFTDADAGEEESKSNPSPSVYTVIAGAYIHNDPVLIHDDPDSSKSRLTWNTKVTWRYLNTVSGQYYIPEGE